MARKSFKKIATRRAVAPAASEGTRASAAPEPMPADFTITRPATSASEV